MKVKTPHTDISERVFPDRGYLAYESEERTIDDGREKKELHAIYCSATGIVYIRGYYFKGSYEASQIKIIKDGVEYIRDFPRYFDVRTLSGLARRFSKEVFNDR